MFGWLFLVILGISTIASKSYGIQNELKMKILERLKIYKQPNVLIAYICWDTVDMVDFTKFLNIKAGLSVTLAEPSVDKIVTPNPDYAHHAMFLADLGCNGSVDLLKEAENLLLLKAPYRWIIFNSANAILESTLSSDNDIVVNIRSLQNKTNDLTKDKDKNTCIPDNKDMRKFQHHDLPRLFNYLEIFPDSDINVIIEHTENGSLELFSVYRSWCGSMLEMEKLNNKSLAVHRQNLQGAPITVCYVITDNDTMNHLSDYRNREIDTITKVNYVLTNHLIDFLNASRSFSFVNSWGYITDDGGWSGMIGELYTKNADVGGSPLFFTADRIPVIDYIAMPSPTRSKFVFRQPKLSYMSNVFALPFRREVWICCFGLVVLIIVILFISTKWEWTTPAYEKDNENDSETLRPSWSDVTLMTIGSMCQQGSNVQLRGVVGRTVILLSFMSLMFLYTSYSANIVALLQSSSSRIKTLSDLLNSRLKFAAHDTVFNHYYFKTATEPVRKAIYQKKIAPPGSKPRFMTLEEGVKKLREGLFAFHMEIGVGYKVVSELFREEEKCGLQEIQYLQVVDPWLAVQKNSSYKEMFKIGFRRIQEYGLQARENWLLYTKKPHCSGTGSMFVSVGIVDCEPALIVLAYGGLISVIFLFMEMMIAYRLRLMQCVSRSRTSPKSIDGKSFDE